MRSASSGFLTVFGLKSGCRRPESLLGCRTCAVPALRYAIDPNFMLAANSRIRQVQAFLVVIAAALLAAVSATADPGTVASKQAQAQQVLGQINQIDQSLNAAVEAYNLANVRLQKIKAICTTTRSSSTLRSPASSTHKRNWSGGS